MNKNNLNNGFKKDDIRKKITSINDDDDDDDIGENYEDDFSENVSREVKYFNPKQSQAPNFHYFNEERPKLNRFQNYQ